MGISEHCAPAWFGECRYGLFIHVNIATVPAFAPLHEYADWYQAFWKPGLPGIVGHPPTPLPEVLAYHAAAFPDVHELDDFLPMLTMEDFDADAIAGLALDAGMRYVVPVTKHHDGFCFWDSALSPRTSTRLGPRRDVIAELAAASRRHDLVFGLYHSLLDWGHPDYPDRDRYVDGYLRPQLAELTERFQPQVLWGDGHWDHDGAWWRADEIVGDYYAAMEELGVEGCVNDRFQSSHADFVTFEYDVPDEPPDGPWELCRGMAHSFCFNRVERPQDHLDGAGVVDLLTEVVAKGGNLLLNIGPKADGTVPAIQADALRDAGAWVRAHADTIHGSSRFTTWGDRTTRYTVSADGAVCAIDLGASTERVFPALRDVTAVAGAIEWAQRDDGLHVRADERLEGGLARVYRAETTSRSPIVVRTEAPRDSGLGERLDRARPGDVVEVGPGRHLAQRLAVPEGVTLTGPRSAVLDGDGQPALALRAGATLAGLTVERGAAGFWFIPPTCITTSGDEITVDGARIEAIQLGGGARHRVLRAEIVGGNLWAFGCEAIEVRGVTQHGLRWGQGIEITGGAGHQVLGCRVSDDLCGIRLTGTADAVVRDNRVSTRWWGIHVRQASTTIVTANVVQSTMRALCVEGGSGNQLLENTARDCDSLAIIEQGARDTMMRANVAHDCRIETLSWDGT